MSELQPKEILKEAERVLLPNKHPLSEKVTSVLKDTALGVGLGVYGTAYMMGRLLMSPFEYIKAVKEVGTPAQVKLAGVIFLGLPIVGTVATYLDGGSPIAVVSTGIALYTMSGFTSALHHANLIKRKK